MKTPLQNALILLILLCCFPAKAAEKPNVLFIIIMLMLFPAVAGLAQQNEELSLDDVRLGLWSRFGTVESFATRLKMPQSKLEQFLSEHQWDLPTAPAVRLTNTDLSGMIESLAPSSKSRLLDAFVNQNGKPDSNTQAIIDCN